RSKNIILTAIIQELNQIKVKYKEDYNTILSSFDTKLLMGTTDTDTINYLIKLAGHYTTDILHDSENADKYSTSTRIDKINTINHSMVRELDKKSQSMVFVRSYNPMILERTYFFEEEEFKEALTQSYWHDIRPNKKIVNYKSLSLETNH